MSTGEKGKIESTTKRPPGRKIDHRRKRENGVNHKKAPQEERLTTGEKEEIESTAKEKRANRG